ncbi:MAG: DeoR family transcriptional regulator [Deltaproteobacteria bacterium]|nr:DeoR family transcriptional regulator [Deltaproteobacteria bacterium]
MTARQQAEVITIMKVGQKHGKRYSFPSQKKILSILKSIHGYEISERTLRRDLRDLEENKLLETTHRKRWIPGSGKVFTSNLYKLKKKVFIWLSEIGAMVDGLFRHYRRPKLADNQLPKKQASLMGALASVDNSVEKVEKLPPEQFQHRIRHLIEGLK